MDLFGRNKQFHVFLDEHNPPSIRRKRPTEKPRIGYCFSWTNEREYVMPGRMYYEFAELTSQCVKSVVVDLAVKEEQEYRKDVFRLHESRVEARKNAIKRLALMEAQAAERKRKALQQLLSLRVDLMCGAVRNMNQADQIRSLIATVQEKSAKARRPVEGLDGWVGWATHYSNVIDPRHMSVEGIEAWIKKFQLRD